MRSKSIDSNVDKKEINKKKLKEAQSNLDDMLKRIKPYIKKKKIVIHSTDRDWAPTSFLH